MSNKKVITFTIFVILGMISSGTIYKVFKEHNNNLIKVVEEEFLFQAKKCFNESNCSNKVYLSDLYEKKYLDEKLTNPISKKYYDDKSYVNLDSKEIKLY